MNNPLRLSRLHPALRATALAAGLALTLGMSASASPHAAVGHAGPSGQDAPLTDEHLRHVVHFLMGHVEGAQKARLVEIAERAKPVFDDLEQRALQARLPRRQVLLASTIDRQALERIRAAEMNVTVERSRRVDELLVDLATALTPTQRAQLLNELQAPGH